MPNRGRKPGKGKASMTDKPYQLRAVPRPRPGESQIGKKGLSIECVPVREWHITVSIFDPQTGDIICQKQSVVENQVAFDPKMMQRALDEFEQEQYAQGSPCLKYIEAFHLGEVALRRRYKL